MGIRNRVKREMRPDKTIREAFNEFIAEKEALNKSPATIQNYEDSFERWMGFLAEGDDEGQLFIKDITSSYTLLFTKQLKDAGLKPATINHYLRDIRTFCNWCMERKYCYHFHIKMVEAQEEMKETYTDEELEILLKKPIKNASFAEWRSWAIVNWLLGTGNRAATVCNYKLGDLDFKNKEAIVRKQKNKKAMYIPLSPQTITAMKEYIKMWRSIDTTEDSYLFPNIAEEQMSVNALQCSIRKYNRDRGVERTSIHAFRHTFAKISVRNGQDIKRLQLAMGHSSIQMTDKYVRLFAEDLKEDIVKYNPLDTIKKGKGRTQRVKRG